jgi:eukaryotic-like serine/threonine-protein kinase
MRKFFSYLGTATFRKNLLIAIGLVIGLLLLAFFSLRFYTRHGDAAPVPKLQGLTIDRAVELLESEGFTYQVDSFYQADTPPGMVVQQDPDPGIMVKHNRMIYLTIITRNAPDVGFPDVVSKTFLEAQAIIANYGLKVGDTAYMPDIKKDRVLDVKFGGVSVRAGQQLPKGSRIDLILGDGRGAAEVDLPDLTGFTVTEAIFALNGLSLQLGQKFYQGTISDTSAARIIMQTPAVSDTLKKVPIGTRVDVVLMNQ